MRSSAFFINGGTGRVICSIPAFEKYQEENPNDDFIIICEGGMEFFKGHPTLHKRAYDSWHKDLFEEKIKDRNCVSLEPYRLWEYYNQKCNLSQAFDMLMNNKGIRDLPRPTIKLTREELINGSNVVNEVKEKAKKDRVIVIQPFGRTVQQVGSFLNDSSGRSFEFKNIVNIIKKLQEKYAVILMSEYQFDFEAEGCNAPVAQPTNITLRQWAGLISAADYFVGCDSVGQHIAYSLDKPATVVVGSTFAENITYPDYEKFDIQDMGEGLRKYDPIRIVPDELVNKNNDGIMLMNGAIEDAITDSIVRNLEKNVTNKNNTIKKSVKSKTSPVKLKAGTEPLNTQEEKK
jgi:hypothetical protein